MKIPILNNILTAFPMQNRFFYLQENFTLRKYERNNENQK